MRTAETFNCIQSLNPTVEVINTRHSVVVPLATLWLTL